MLCAHVAHTSAWCSLRTHGWTDACMGSHAGPLWYISDAGLVLYTHAKLAPRSRRARTRRRCRRSKEAPEVCACASRGMSVSYLSHTCVNSRLSCHLSPYHCYGYCVYACCCLWVPRSIRMCECTHVMVMFWCSRLFAALILAQRFWPRMSHFSACGQSLIFWACHLRLCGRGS